MKRNTPSRALVHTRSTNALRGHHGGVPTSAPDVLRQIAALQSKGFSDLNAMWRDLFGTEAPRYGIQFLRSRLAYRLQELAFGGMRASTLARLDALADELSQEMTSGTKRARRNDRHRPIAGTRLIREWQGIEHVVTVKDEGYEFEGWPYKSLSAIARAITGTRWNGWAFFGLRSPASSKVR